MGETDAGSHDRAVTSTWPAALVDCLSAIEMRLRQQLGPRRAHVTVTALALVASQSDSTLWSTLPYPVTADEVLAATESSVQPVAEALDLPGVLTNLHRNGMLDDVLHLVTTCVANASVTERAMATDWLLRRSAEPIAGIFTIPNELASLVADLAVGASDKDSSARIEARQYRLFDPHSGCGELLLALARRIRSGGGDVLASGREPSSEALAIAKASLAVHGVAVSDLSPNEWLLEPVDRELRYDYIISAIPSTPWQHLEYRLAASALGSARPRSSDSTLLYVARIAQLVADLRVQRAVIVVSSAPLSTGRTGSGDVQLRRAIAQTGCIQAIVAVPSGILESTAVAPTIMVLSPPDVGRGDAEFE